jgi:hypothetical protein
MSSVEDVILGVVLDNGCRITQWSQHQETVRRHEDPTMHELSPKNAGFRGQLGYIEFTSKIRLPRHIHMDASKQKLVNERILVLNGVGLVEIAGKIWAAAPSTSISWAEFSTRGRPVLLALVCPTVRCPRASS